MAHGADARVGLPNIWDDGRVVWLRLPSEEGSAPGSRYNLLEALH